MKVASSISFRTARAAAINHIHRYNLHYITIQITITWPGLPTTTTTTTTDVRAKIFNGRKKKHILFRPRVMTFLTRLRKDDIVTILQAHVLQALYSIGAVAHNITEACIVKENALSVQTLPCSIFQIPEYDVTESIRKYATTGPLRIRVRRASVKIT